MQTITAPPSLPKIGKTLMLILCSVISIVILVWLLVTYVLKVNSVSSCCNVFYEKRDNQTDITYNVEKPEERESCIDNDIEVLSN